MKSVIAVAALAGLTAASTAQTIGSVTLTASHTSAAIGDEITIGVVLSDNIAGNSVFAFDINAISLASTLRIVPGSIQADGGVFGFASSEETHSVTGLGGASDILGPTLDASLDGVQVFSFQVVVVSAAIPSMSVTAADGAGPNPAMQWGLEGGIVILPQDYDEITFNTVTITIPSPATAVTLPLAAALAGRRRR